VGRCEEKKQAGLLDRVSTDVHDGITSRSTCVVEMQSDASVPENEVLAGICPAGHAAYRRRVLKNFIFISSASLRLNKHAPLLPFRRIADLRRKCDNDPGAHSEERPLPR
jgi:hypothetical protein